jgi:hypothetical protein
MKKQQEIAAKNYCQTRGIKGYIFYNAKITVLNLFIALHSLEFSGYQDE